MKPKIEIATSINEDGTAECHCTDIADKYYQRTFTNNLGWKVTRVFYRCRNCWSRLSYDFFPKEKTKSISVFDLMKKYNIGQ